MQVTQGEVHTVHPPMAVDRNEPEGQTQVLVGVIGNPSVQVRQLVAELTQVAHGEVQRLHPP